MPLALGKILHIMSIRDASYCNSCIATKFIIIFIIPTILTLLGQSQVLTFKTPKNRDVPIF